MKIILLSLGGAVIANIIGTLWYSMKTPMGRLHMKYIGFDKLSPEEQKNKIAEAKPHMWKSYLAQMILSLFTSFFIVFVTTMSVAHGEPAKIVFFYIIFAWLSFMVPVIGSSLLWGNCDRTIVWKKFFSDIGANLFTLIIIALFTILFV